MQSSILTTDPDRRHVKDSGRMEHKLSSQITLSIVIDLFFQHFNKAISPGTL